MEELFVEYLDYKNLDREEERELFSNLSNENRDKIIQSHLKLVIFICRKYKFFSGQLYHDLVQEGTIGLIESIDKFDLSKNCRFSTFAQYYIRSRVFQHLRDTAFHFHVPHKSLRFLIILKNKNLEDLYKNDYLKQISHELGVSLPQLKKWRQYLSELNQPFEYIEKKEKKRFEDDEVLNLAQNKINHLSKEDKEIIHLRHEHQLSWRKISEKTRFSHEGIRKKYNKIIDDIRDFVLS